MRVSTRITAAAVAAALAATLVACGSDEVATGDGAGDVPTVEPATPSVSPPLGHQPAGTVIAGVGGTALAQAGSTVAVLGTDGTVALHTAPGAADTPPPRDSGATEVTALTADGDGFLAVSPAQLSRIGADGGVQPIAGDQGPAVSVAVADDGRILVGTDDGHLRVIARDGSLQRDIHEFVRVDQILVAPASSPMAGQVVVVDRAQSMVAPIDIDTGERKAALRAGNGLAVGTVDSHGRVLATGTADNELLGFYGQPIVMRFRFPVSPGPYALAWDDTQQLLWVSTTGDNQAVAYELSTGEPIERGRIATVGQVSAMTADPANGMLYLVSERGDGLQAVPRTVVDGPR